MANIVKNLVAIAVIGMIEHLLALYLRPLLYVDLFLLYSVYAGLMMQQVSAAYSGFLAGALQDLLSGFPIGVNGFSKTILGFGIATVNRYVILDSLWVRLGAVLAASLINSAVLACLLYTLEQSIPVHFFQTSVIQATSNSMAALILFQIADRIRRGGKKQLARPYAD
ncbi:MAG TPA: rod shape-determining protein MreD [Acidobacteriota bacterium]